MQGAVLTWRRFAGFIAIANTTGSARFICIGSGCSVLASAKAAAVIGAFSWVAWMVTLALIGDAIIKSRKMGEHAADPQAAAAAQA